MGFSEGSRQAVLVAAGARRTCRVGQDLDGSRSRRRSSLPSTGRCPPTSTRNAGRRRSTRREFAFDVVEHETAVSSGSVRQGHRDGGRGGLQGARHRLPVARLERPRRPAGDRRPDRLPHERQQLRRMEGRDADSDPADRRSDRGGLHIIACLRAKMDYTQEKDDRGRTKITKVGLAPVQREGMEYEFDVVGDMTVLHNLMVSKDPLRRTDGPDVRQAGQGLRPDSLELDAVRRDP